MTKKVFTGDALPCQKQTVNLITGVGNNYLMSLKKNQASLYKCLEHQAKTTRLLSLNLTEDISHGRHITEKFQFFKPRTRYNICGESVKNFSLLTELELEA